MATTDVVMSGVRGHRMPAAKFDMLFFVHVMGEICGRHEQLRTVFSTIEDSGEGEH
jgi:hypothetical protein